MLKPATTTMTSTRTAKKWTIGWEGWDWHWTTTLHVHHALVYISFCHCTITTWNFLISRRFCELRYSTVEFNSWKIANIWQIKGVGIRVMKFETARILFLGDVFCCRCRRRYLSSLITRIYHWYFKHTLFLVISIGNSMTCSDIWHKYHEWYFEIVIR